MTSFCMAAQILYLLRLLFTCSCDFEEHRGDSGLPWRKVTPAALTRRGEGNTLLSSVRDLGILPLSGLVSLWNVSLLLPGLRSVGIVRKESPLEVAEMCKRPRGGGETRSVGSRALMCCRVLAQEKHPGVFAKPGLFWGENWTCFRNPHVALRVTFHVWFDSRAPSCTRQGVQGSNSAWVTKEGGRDGLHKHPKIWKPWGSQFCSLQKPKPGLKLSRAQRNTTISPSSFRLQINCLSLIYIYVLTYFLECSSVLSAAHQSCCSTTGSLVRQITLCG